MKKGNIKLKSSDFLTNVSSSFSNLHGHKLFTDVTLVSDDNKQIQAHKLILSSGSEYFRHILSDKSHPHPMLCLDGISSEDLDSIIKYLYVGEVSVPQSSLQKFLRIANKLKCFGLNEEEPQLSETVQTEEKYINPENTYEDNEEVEFLDKRDHKPIYIKTEPENLDKEQQNTEFKISEDNSTNQLIFMGESDLKDNGALFVESEDEHFMDKGQTVSSFDERVNEQNLDEEQQDNRTLLENEEEEFLDERDHEPIGIKTDSDFI